MATTVASPTEERAGQISIRQSARVSRRSLPAGNESESSSRFFLPKAGANGNTLELGREFSSEGEARVEALKLGVTYYSIQEWRPVADFAGKNPELKRESVSRKGAL
jgi:hypothetical protein